MILNAGEPTVATICCRLINKDTGEHIVDQEIETWDTTNQTVYTTSDTKRPELITEFTIPKNLLEVLEYEYGGKELLDKDITDKKVKIVFTD